MAKCTAPHIARYVALPTATYVAQPIKFDLLLFYLLLYTLSILGLAKCVIAWYPYRYHVGLTQ